jgi:hypothetical protein
MTSPIPRFPLMRRPPTYDVPPTLEELFKGRRPEGRGDGAVRNVAN